MALQQFFRVWIVLKTKKETSGRPFVGSFTLKDRDSKSSSDFFLKQKDK